MNFGFLFPFELSGRLCQFQLYFKFISEETLIISLVFFAGAIFIVCLLITSRFEFLLNLRPEKLLISYQFGS